MSITLVQKNKSKGILTWYARVPDKLKGSVHFFSLGTSSKSEAKILLQERIREGAYDSRVTPSAITLGEAVEKYEQYKRANGIKEGSLSMYINSLRSLSSLYDRQVAGITKAEIADAFLNSNDDVNSTTYNNNKTVVSMLFQYLVDVLEVIPNNPIPKAIPRRKKLKPVKYAWNLEEIDRIIAAAPTPNVRLAWALMAFAGLRRSEVMKLKPEDIHDGYIHVLGKGDKHAEIPVSPRLQRELERHGMEWGKLYVNHKTIVKYAEIALPEGFKGKAHAHRFRYSYGSILCKKGVNIKVLQRLMRHENIKITLDTYVHILDNDAEDAISKVFT